MFFKFSRRWISWIASPATRNFSPCLWNHWSLSTLHLEVWPALVRLQGLSLFVEKAEIHGLLPLRVSWWPYRWRGDPAKRTNPRKHQKLVETLVRIKKLRYPEDICFVQRPSQSGMPGPQNMKHYETQLNKYQKRTPGMVACVPARNRPANSSLVK